MCPGDLVDNGAGACQCTRVSHGFPEIENGGTCAYDCPNAIPGSFNVPDFFGCECPLDQIFDFTGLPGSGPTGRKCIPDCATILIGSSLIGGTCTCPANRIDNRAGACTRRIRAPPNDRDRDRRSSDRGGGGDGLGALAASAAAASLISQEILDDFWASLRALLELFASAGELNP